jgi:hypothetical protein
MIPTNKIGSSLIKRIGPIPFYCYGKSVANAFKFDWKIAYFKDKEIRDYPSLAIS